MSKRRISPKTASNIASVRMTVLFSLASDALKKGNGERARRYVSLARRIGQKTNTPVPEGAFFCKNCNMPLIAGTNCRVRFRDGRIKTTCLSCGDIRRMPHTREQRE